MGMPVCNCGIKINSKLDKRNHADQQSGRYMGRWSSEIKGSIQYNMVRKGRKQACTPPGLCVSESLRMKSEVSCEICVSACLSQYLRKYCSFLV